MRSLAKSLALAALLVAGTAAAKSLEFGTVIDNLDLRKVTKMAASEYCKNARGTDVSWSGEVHDVKGGRRNIAKVFVADRSRPIYNGYNIVVVTSDYDKAATVKKGQRVRFTGQIDRCQLKKNGAIIEVENATLK